jgi:hypothetical protein
MAMLQPDARIVFDDFIPFAVKQWVKLNHIVVFRGAKDSAGIEVIALHTLGGAGQYVVIVDFRFSGAYRCVVDDPPSNLLYSYGSLRDHNLTYLVA